MSPREECAPGSFMEERTEVDDDIGYGKVKTIFHLLRRKVGDELFHRSLKTTSQVYDRKRAS